MNPFNDLFLSTSNDRTSRLWDLNKKKCLCIFQDSQCAAFDNTGKVLASVTFNMNKETERYENFISERCPCRLCNVKDTYKQNNKLY